MEDSALTRHQPLALDVMRESMRCAVRAKRERDEHRRPVDLAVRSGEGRSHCALVHGDLREVGRVLASSGRTDPAGGVRIISLRLTINRQIIYRRFGFGVAVPALAALLHA